MVENILFDGSGRVDHLFNLKIRSQMVSVSHLLADLDVKR